MEAKQDYVVFDADKKVLGRLASATAKALLGGKSVVIVNAEKALVSGRKGYILSRYRTRLNLQDKANPEHSPYWPRRPDMFVKRIVRGMLPYRMPRGKDAYRRLRVYSGIPDEFSGKAQALSDADARKMYVNTMTVSELAGLLGYKSEE